MQVIIAGNLSQALELAQFQLRVDMLVQAAFKSSFPYRPKLLLKKIDARVRAAKHDRTHHIAAVSFVSNNDELLC